MSGQLSALYIARAQLELADRVARVLEEELLRIALGEAAGRDGVRVLGAERHQHGDPAHDGSSRAVE